MSGKVLNSVFHFLQVAWRANTNPITCPASYHGIADRTRFVSEEEQIRQTFVDFREKICPERAGVTSSSNPSSDGPFTLFGFASCNLL